MTQITVVKSDKGGVGKTVIAYNVASGLATTGQIRDWKFSGEPTLLLDLDPKSDAALSLGLARQPHIYNWIVENQPLSSCIQATNQKDLFILSGDASTYDALEMVELQMLRKSKPADFFSKKILEIVDAVGFEHIIIDMPPVDSLFTRDPLRIAHRLIVPTKADRIDVAGAMTTIAQAKVLNPNLEVFVVPSIWHTRQNLDDSTFDLLKAKFQDRLLSPIPDAVAVSEARSVGQTIWQYTRAPRILMPFVQIVNLMKGVDHGDAVAN